MADEEVIKNPCQPSKCTCIFRSFEPTTPVTKFNHSGVSSSQSSMMKTRRIYNLMLLRIFCIKPIERSTVGRKQQRGELNLTLNAEMLHGHMVDFYNDINNFARHRVKRAAESADRTFGSTVNLSEKIFVAKHINKFFATVQRVPT